MRTAALLHLQPCLRMQALTGTGIRTQSAHVRIKTGTEKHRQNDGRQERQAYILSISRRGRFVRTCLTIDTNSSKSKLPSAFASAPTARCARGHVCVYACVRAHAHGLVITRKLVRASVGAVWVGTGWREGGARRHKVGEEARAPNNERIRSSTRCCSSCHISSMKRRKLSKSICLYNIHFVSLLPQGRVGERAADRVQAQLTALEYPLRRPDDTFCSVLILAIQPDVAAHLMQQEHECVRVY